MLNKVVIYAIMFLVGFLSCMLITFAEVEMPLGINFNSEIEAPGDWIKESQIHVYENIVVIDIEKASLSRYAPTGSMLPVLDKDSNGIRIVPENEEQIEIGDIITFEQDNQLIVHRVIEIGTDNEGTYFITKGDNNNVIDGKVRFRDIKYVTIAIIW